MRVLIPMERDATLLWFLLFVVARGSVAVVALSGWRAGTRKFLFGQLVLGGGFALLPEDALWRSRPVALLVAILQSGGFQLIFK